MTGTISGQNKELFDYAIQGVLRREGHFTSDLTDPGGATNFGISLRYLKQLAQSDLVQYDYNGDGIVDDADIRLLQLDTAKEIYFKEFWIKPQIYLIKSELIACKMLDVCVNIGPRQAWKLLQDCLGNVMVDGVPGPKTMNSLDDWTVHDYDMLRYLRSSQEKFYNSLVDRNGKLVKYIIGWRRRAAV